MSGLGDCEAAFLPTLSCSDLENDFLSYPKSEFLEGFSHFLARVLARFEVLRRSEDVKKVMTQWMLTKGSLSMVSLITADKNE